MWLVLGPLVIRRAAPRLVRNLMADIAGLTEDEIAAEKGDFFKAMTKKQGETFGQAIYGALGNIVQTSDTGELIEKAKSLIPPGTDLSKLVGSPDGLSQLTPLLQMFGDAKGGTKNPFMGLVQMMMAMQLLTTIGSGQSGGGLGTLLGGGGTTGGSVGGTSNPFLGELGIRR